MKKIFAILSVVTFIGCSSDDNTITNTENNDNNDSNNENIPEFTSNKKLASYTLTNFPSGNTITHNFNGNKGINAVKNDEVRFKLEYNSEDKLSEYIGYRETNFDQIEFSYSFNYTDGKISSAKWVDDKNVLFPEKTYDLNFTYNENIITAESESIDSEKIQYLIELNKDNLIISFIKNKISSSILGGVTTDQVNLVFSEKFIYDDNKNCTNVSHTVRDLNGNDVTRTTVYKYDTGKNPLYDFHTNNYLQLALIYAENASIFSVGLHEIIEQFGTLNHKDTFISGKAIESGKIVYDNEYNSDGTLKKQTVTDIISGIEEQNTTFIYK